MSELLTIDGMVLTGREGAGAEVRPEVLSAPPPHSAPRWLLPLAAAALLHLGVLVILGVMVRSVPGPEGGPEVLPIRLYAAGEVSALADSAESARPRQTPGQAGPVKTKSGKGELNAPAMSVAGVGVPVSVQEVVALLRSAPPAPSVAAREVSFSAPGIPEIADGVGGQSLATASEVGGPGSQLGRVSDNQAGGGVASGDQSMVVSGADSGVVLAYPLYRENPPPEYPPLARRRQLEGTVVLEAQVGADGLVEGLALHQSSGHRLLDEAALKGVKGWRFEPGRRGATAVAMKVLVPVRFGLR